MEKVANFILYHFVNQFTKSRKKIYESAVEFSTSCNNTHSPDDYYSPDDYFSKGHIHIHRE